MKKIYVAAKFENKAKVKEVQRELRKSGFGISHDWTNESSEGLTGAELRTYLQTCAREDLEGARDADAVVVIYDKTLGGRGLYVEIGAALATVKPVVIIGDREDCIFSHLCEYCETLPKAIEFLRAALSPKSSCW